MRPLFLVGLLLAVPLLTGCLGLGGEDGADDRPELKNQATADESTGGIQGVVTDPAIQPIEGAEVTLQGLGQSTTTASDGSFAFSNLAPRDYTLEITADGFVSTTVDVSVSSGKVATSDTILAQKPTTQAFMQQQEFTGFVECSASTPVVAVAVCAIPNFFVSNTTNDRFMFTWEVEPNLHQLTAEIDWDPSQPTGTHLSFNIEPAGISNEPTTTYAEPVGEGPLVANIDREALEAVEANMTAICNEEAEPQGAISPSNPDAYCRPNLLEEGGAFQARIFVSNADPIPAGTNLQQEYHVIVTMFYNAPACQDHSVFLDNPCDQQEPASEDETSQAR